MKTYIFSKEIFIEAENKQDALLQLELFLTRYNGLPEAVDTDNWNVREIQSKDLDQYRELP